jgi:hypothetical protein
MLGDGCDVTRAVQNADDYEFSVVVEIVDGLIAGDADAKGWRKTLARWAGEWKSEKRLAIRFDLVDDPCRGRRGGFGGDVKPDFGEVGLCGIG